MGFSDRILGKKNVNGGPRIESVAPAAGACRRRTPHHRLRPSPAGTAPPESEVRRSRRIHRRQLRRIPGGARTRRRNLRPGRGRHRRPRQQSAHRQGRRPHRRESSSRHQSRGRRRRQHLRHLLRIARTESSCRHLQDRHQLQREAVRHRDDERHLHRLRPRRDRCTFPRATTAPSIASLRTAP